MNYSLHLLKRQKLAVITKPMWGKSHSTVITGFIPLPNCRIMEWFSWEGSLKIIQFQGCHGQACFLLDTVAQGPIQPGLQHDAAAVQNAG